MNNIFSFNKPVKHTGRNGFDNSFSRVLKLRPSFVRPIKAFDTVPNSSYKIDIQDLVRTSALQTAAFLRGSQELDVYFVPYSQLYSRSNDIILSRGEDTSVSHSVLSGTEFPHVPLCSLILHASLPYLFERSIIHYRDCLLYLSGKTSFDYDIPLSLSDFAQSFWYSLFGLCPYNDVVDQFVYSQNLFTPYIEYPILGNVINRLSEIIQSTEFVGADSLQLLSTLDYGDYYIMIKSIMDSLVSTMESDMDILLAESAPDPFNENIFLGWFHGSFLEDRLRNRLIDFLSSIDFHFNWKSLDISKTKNVSLLHLAAYQKVWRDFYRDSINDDSQLYLYASNLDWDISPLLASPDTINQSNHFFLLTFLRPHLRTMKRDLANGGYPSTQFGLAATATGTEKDDLNIPSELNPVSPYSAVSIKFALAMQRYKQTLMRAGNRTKDLLKAEFGVQSHYVNDVYPHHLGSFSGALDLNKVTATAETGTYSVGDLAGNVFSTLQGKQIEFTCNDHGIILFCLSFVCDPLHNNFGVSPFNTKLRTYDFFKEDFENLGLQPVSSSLFSPFVIDTDNKSLISDPTTLGFSARYNEYKQQFDTVHDTFVTHSLIPDSADPNYVGFKWTDNGVDSNYVTVRDICQTLSNLSDRSYLMPSCMDTIFKTYDSGLPEDSHFDIAISVNIQSILPMSTLGLI